MAVIHGVLDRTKKMKTQCLTERHVITTQYTRTIQIIQYNLAEKNTLIRKNGALDFNPYVI